MVVLSLRQAVLLACLLALPGQRMIMMMPCNEDLRMDMLDLTGRGVCLLSSMRDMNSLCTLIDMLVIQCSLLAC